jgi:multiple sugar transport system ATP-binding protein
MVFQSYALYPHMSVADNMGLALRLHGVPKKDRDRKVLHAARILQLEALLNRKPKQLSGGQRQRVAIGRAIVREPKAFLFDEPLSNLDAALRVQTRLEIAKLHRELKATTIYVTHDQVEAMTLADRIVVLNGGHIEQVGSPLELYHRPANLFVAAFIGSPKMNLIQATVKAATNSSITLELQGGGVLETEAVGLHSGDQVTVGIRPEYIAIGADGSIAGKVDVVEHLGSEIIAYVETGAGKPLTVKASPSTRIAVGDLVQLDVQPGAAIVFGSDGQSMTQANLNSQTNGLAIHAA